MKPEYDAWAAYLLQEIYYTPEEHRSALVKEHLIKAVRRGYTDALENGWWRAQEESFRPPTIGEAHLDRYMEEQRACGHKSDGNLYFSNPSKSKCRDCGEFYS